MNKMNKMYVKLKDIIIEKVVRAENGDFGINSVIGVAIGLIVAAFVLIPGFNTLANAIVDDMQNWWNNSISSKVFPV